MLLRTEEGETLNPFKILDVWIPPLRNPGSASAGWSEHCIYYRPNIYAIHVITEIRKKNLVFWPIYRQTGAVIFL